MSLSQQEDNRKLHVFHVMVTEALGGIPDSVLTDFVVRDGQPGCADDN
jgi:hypothetical protein